MPIGDVVKRWLDPSSRSKPAGTHKFAIMSRVIYEKDQRPIYVYRAKPVRRSDSGWVLTVGEKAFPTDQAEAEAVLVSAHIGHVAEHFPELAEVFADGRPESAWEWDKARGRYREIDTRPAGS